MSLLYRLSDRGTWDAFLEYKRSLACPKPFVRRLEKYIENGEYVPVAERIARGDPFPLPEKSVISKQGSDKKRVVYTYPEPENTALKLLTHLVLRKYDGIFADGLFSFRPGVTAKDAVRRLLRTPGIFGLYSYKADVSDYFNSIPTDRMIPLLRDVLADDAPLADFLTSLLAEPRVLDRRTVITEQKGIMAGTPQSSFYANLFLSDLDRRLSGAAYSRYSDDIIVFARTREETEERAGFIRSYLADRLLSLNPAKEEFHAPGEGFTYLGFFCSPERVDIAPATLRKLKAKMRRKRDALARWAKRNGEDPERAARAFIRIFNRKLLESPRDNELSWSRWFFPVISTTDSLSEIDRFSQDCIRYLLTGTHTKARFLARYADLKSLGYRSLVHEYYSEK